MPVRSSLCTYSPAAAAASGRSSVLGGSKYSSVLSSPSSYGHYKPLTSSGRGYASPSSTEGRYSHLSYSPSSSSSSSSSATSSSPTVSSAYSTGSGSVGLYKPLSSMRRYPSSGGQAPRPFSSTSSPSTSSLTSTSSTLSSASGSGLDQLAPSGCAYQPYKSSSSLSTSAYSSGSLSSSPSSTSSSSSTGSSSSSAIYSTSPYSSLRQSRFLTSSRAQAAASSGGRSESLPPDAPSGLVNLGNTCYMNASLQALYSLDPFRGLIASAGRERGGGGERPITSELAELFKQMKESAQTGQPLSPANFKYVFARHQGKFSGFGQQDAQEFLHYLIDGIHEELNAARRRKRQRHSSAAAPAPRNAQEAWAQYREIVDDSPLVDLLVGQLCSTITCCECHNKSHCWDPFWDLSLPLSSRAGGRGASGGGSSHPSGGSTSSAGSLSSWRSVGSSGSGSSCGSYGSYRSTRLSGIIDEFTSKETLDSDERPHCSHCKRPTRSTKQISLARLPRVLILHLKKFTNDGYKLTSPELQIDKHLTFDGHHYQLRACISHHGHSSSSGHYTSNCEYSTRWLHFDDGRVRDVTQTFDCNKLDDAYVLFYTQQQPKVSSSSSSSSSLAGSSRRPSRSSPPPPGDAITSQSKL